MKYLTSNKNTVMICVLLVILTFDTCEKAKPRKPL